MNNRHDGWHSFGAPSDQPNYIDWYDYQGGTNQCEWTPPTYRARLSGPIRRPQFNQYGLQPVLRATNQYFRGNNFFAASHDDNYHYEPVNQSSSNNAYVGQRYCTEKASADKSSRGGKRMLPHSERIMQNDVKKAKQQHGKFEPVSLQAMATRVASNRNQDIIYGI